eukprot:SAG31_NODE_1609_length_7753_cov_12.390253_11_plen_64_part_00
MRHRRDVNAVIEEAVAVAAQNLKIPVIKLNMMKLRALSTEYGIGVSCCTVVHFIQTILLEFNR